MLARLQPNKPSGLSVHLHREAPGVFAEPVECLFKPQKIQRLCALGRLIHEYFSLHVSHFLGATLETREYVLACREKGVSSIYPPKLVILSTIVCVPVIPALTVVCSFARQGSVSWATVSSHLCSSTLPDLDDGR